jgi:hypothetical protein
MHIGDDKTYLMIERAVSSDPYGPLRMQARAELRGDVFLGSNSSVFFGDYAGPHC